MLRRLPYVLAALVVDLIPVAVFAAMGHALLTTPLGATTNARLVVLAVVDAYVICRVIMCVTRTFVSPSNHRLRLVQVRRRSGRCIIERWMSAGSAPWRCSASRRRRWGCCSGCTGPRTTCS